MIKNNVYYELFASVAVPNPEEVGYWVDLGADFHGNIIKFFDKNINRWVKLTDATSEYATPPYIGSNGNWFIENRDSGIPAAGKNPYIGEDFNWWVFDPVNNKYVDTGIRAKGLTAYEIAVNHGFVGTEEEWVESLKKPALDAAAVALEAADKANQATEDAKLATDNAEIATDEANRAADRSNTIASNPPKIVNEEWYMYDETLDDYRSTGIKAIGDAFTIEKTYPSIEAMQADYDNPEVGIGQFVMIDTGDVENPEDSQLFLKGEDGWKFIADLSGAQGIQGLSAYQVAVQNGFVGTEAEWVASLSQASEDAAKEALAAKAQVEATEAAVKAAEALRVTAEEGRVDAENTRVSNETAREEAEANRVDAEDARVTEEAKRVTNETARDTAESTRINAEAVRKTNEDARKTAESARATAESSRFTAEQTRVTNETARKAAEDARVIAETARDTAETDRNTAETNRVTAENERDSQETNRQANEVTRQAQEAERQTNTANAITAVNEAKTATETATTNATTAATNANNQANRAKEYADNPPKIQNNYWYVWDDTTDAYINTNHVATGDPGKSPKIDNGTWWIYDLDTSTYVDTGIAVSSDYVLTKAKVEAVLTGDITSHNHDSMYYTESEVDALLAEVQPKINVIDNLTSTSATDPLSAKQGKILNEGKVDKVAGKGLSENDYTTIEKDKLAGIEAGAEVNVNADWNATSGDANILNKPVLSTVATSGSYDDLSDKPTIPTKTSELTKDDVYSKTEADELLSSKVNSSLLGANSGVAQLDATGKVPASQLPSYVDDVLEFDNLAAFPETGEDGKIYIAVDTNLTYRWSGTGYIKIASDLALGETAATAYAGDKGKKNADDIATINTKLTTVETGAQVNKIEAIEKRGADLAITNKKVTIPEDIAITPDTPTGKEILWFDTDEDYDFAFGGYTREEADAKFVIKESNKGLSTNDYTNDEKTKLAGLSNYDDTEVRTEIAKKIDTTVADGKFALKSEIPSLITVDNTLSTTSENPVQNKVITTAINAKLSDAPVDDKQYARKNGEWVEVESGVKGETAKITVTSNQAQPDAAIDGCIVIITYGDNTTTLTWQGTELSVDIPINMSYTVTCSPIEGYATPQAKTYVALMGNTRNISLSYNTTITTINVTSNQSAADFTNAVTVNLTGGITKTLSGALSYTLKIPTDINYTVVGGKVSNTFKKEYTTPANQTIKSVGVTQTVSLNYTGCKLTISVVSTEGSVSPTISINKNNTSFDSLTIASGSSQNVILPMNSTDSYTLIGSDVTNYLTPANVTGIVPNAASISKSVTYTFLSEQVYAYWVIFDESQSTTTLERGGNAEIRDAIRAKFKRCLAKPQANGKAAIAYLKDTDSTYWPDGTSASFSVSNSGNWMMVHFPKYYYRSEDLGGKRYKFYISDRKLNDNYKEEPECLIGAFQASEDSGRLSSGYNAVSIASQTITSFYDKAQANGSKWGLIDYRAHKTIANMFAIMYGNTDISTLNSNIPCSGGTAIYNSGYNGGTLTLGNTDGRLPQYGATNYNSTSFLGLEDCYYGKWEFVQGINISNRAWTVYDNGLLVNADAGVLQNEGFTNIRTIGSAPNSDGYITGIKHGEYADVMPTNITGGSSTTYYADYYYQSSGDRIFIRSGASDYGAGCGVFVSRASNASSSSYTAVGSRLGFYGDIEVKTKDQWLALSPVYTG